MPPAEHHLTLPEEVIEHNCNKTFTENAFKDSRAEFVAFDKDIKTNIPEVERNQSRSNFEVFEDKFTHGSLVSLHSLPRPDALYDRDVPHATRLCRALNPVPPDDEFHRSRIHRSSLTSASSPSPRGTSRTSSRRAVERRKGLQTTHMTAARVQRRRAVFFEPKKGCLRKRLKCHS